MGEVSRTLAHARQLGTLSREEERSITHGDFWVPEAERSLYKTALTALNGAESRTSSRVRTRFTSTPAFTAKRRISTSSSSRRTS